MSEYPQMLEQVKTLATKWHRDPPPLLMGVSKRQSLEKMNEAYEAGLRDFGENYAQELVQKAEYFHEHGRRDAHFHFIGQLQTNKVKLILPFVEAIHSVDSLRLAQEIDKCAKKINKRISCYLQINIDDESTKAGFLAADLEGVLDAIAKFDSILLAGLMCIPDPERDPKAAFLKMREYSKQYSRNLGAGLSMGMSNDYALAIEYGSTVIRVGSALFGART